MQARQKAEKKGRMAEHVALAFLVAKGYQLVEQRYKTPYGEIDLLVKRGDWLVAVEVKLRKEGAAEAVTRRNQKRVADAFQLFVANRPEFAQYNMRMDAVLFDGGWVPRHIEHAWEMET